MKHQCACGSHAVVAIMFPGPPWWSAVALRTDMSLAEDRKQPLEFSSCLFIIYVRETCSKIYISLPLYICMWLKNKTYDWRFSNPKVPVSYPAVTECQIHDTKRETEGERKEIEVELARESLCCAGILC